MAARYAKAEAYAHLHKPYLVNNLEKQWDLLDRRVVYKTLMDNDIPAGKGGGGGRGKPSRLLSMSHHRKVTRLASTLMFKPSRHTIADRV